MFCELYVNNAFSSPCDKLYKRENINSYFDINISSWEDLIFNFEYLKNVSTMSFITNTLYNYICLSSDSLSKKYKENAFDMELQLFKKASEFCENCLSVDFDMWGVNTHFVQFVFSIIQPLVYSSELSKDDKINQISKWIYNESVQKASTNVKFENLQLKLIGFLIKKKNVNAIYVYFNIKYKLFKIMKFVQNKLKQI